jgi:hypothetical protein
MRGNLRSRIAWLTLVALISIAWGVLAQETPPQTSQAAASSASTITETLISWREAILVIMLVVVVFAGLIGYEWVRKRA